MTHDNEPIAEPPTPGGEMKPFWANDVRISADWVRGTETPESIGDRLTRITRFLQEHPGITPWKETDLYGPEWPTDPAGQLDAIHRRVMTDNENKPAPEDGYYISLYSLATRGPARGLNISLHIDAGVRYTDRPHTTEGTRIRIGPDLFQFQVPPPGAHIPVPLAETILHHTITTWDPLYALLSSEWRPAGAPPPYPPNPFFRPSHHRWQIPTGYRVWLHDTLGPVTHLAPGITATPFHTGTMLTAPDHWTPQHVGEAMFTTLDLNNINEIPH